MPKRIQRKRTKGWRMPENAVYVGRPSRYGNLYKVIEDGEKFFVVDTQYPDDPISGPFATKADALEDAVNLYKALMVLVVSWEIADLSELQGKDLACWCLLEDENGNPVPCHADVLLELINKQED